MCDSLYFDTNIYRELTLNLTPDQIQSRFSKFAEIGLEKNIDSHVHIYVIYELLSHLSSPSDPNFENCKNAILAINHHCRDSKTSEFKYINDFDSELIKHFFSNHRKETDVVYDICSRICDYIYTNQADNLLEPIRPDLVNFTSTVSDIESDFVKYYESLINIIDTSTRNWHLNKNDRSMRRKNLKFLNSKEFIEILAREEVHRLCVYANEKITEENISKFTKFLIDNYLFSLVIKVEILRRIIESGYDLSKKNRGNWFWDIQLASCVNTNKDITVMPYIFITSDQGILKIAKKYDYQNRVISKQDYFKLLKVDL